MLKYKKFFLKETIFFILTFLLVFFFFIINNFFTNKDNSLEKSIDENLYKYKNYNIHCAQINIFQNCIEGLISRKNKIKIIFIGNSQLHTINNLKKDQELISEILFKDYINDNIDIITLSLPNINLQETLWILENQLKNVNFSYLILPLVFDDFRERGLRTEFNIKDIQKKEKEHNLKIIKARLEHEKNNLVFNLYNLRNYIFSINSSTTRRIIKSSYLINFESYEDILYLMKKNNIKTISYFAPVRQEPNKIYDQSEYAKFKDEIINLNIKFSHMIFDLDKSVESKHFGLIDENNLDYMHINYEGHLALFNEIKNILNSQIKNKNDF